MDAIAVKKEEVARDRKAILETLQFHADQTRLLLGNLADLEDKDRSLDRELARLKNERTPVLCLPYEITCHIFEMAQLQFRYNYDHPDYRPISTHWRKRSHLPPRPEISVSRVCQDWRQVALSSPTLWSHIVIENWGSGDDDRRVERLAVYLARAQQTPLDIILTVWSFRNGWIPVTRGCTDTLRDVLHRLLPYSARWQRLAIWMEGEWDLSVLSALEDVAVPRLEVFEVGCWPARNPDYPYAAAGSGPSDLPILFKLGAPRLTSSFMNASLHLYQYPRFLSTVYLQRGPRFRPWADFVTLFQLPNLTNLTLDSNGWMIYEPPTSTTDATRIIAPNLRHLRLGCATVFDHMWDTLSAPNLEILVVFALPDPVDIPNTQNSFIGFFPALKTLALWSFEMRHPVDLLHLALATPQVTELIICECIPWGTFLQSLYAQSLAKNKDLWPHLRSFSHIVGFGHWFTGDVLLHASELSYKLAREALEHFTDWRLETFGHKCALCLDYPDYNNDDDRPRLNDPFVSIPECDGSEEERARWKKYMIPRGRRIIPWPEEEEIGFGYHEKVGFNNASVTSKAEDDAYYLPS